MVYDPSVDLFGNSVVVAPIPRFHMKDRYPSTCANYRRQSTVCIAKDKDPVRPVLRQQAVDLRKDLPGLIAEALCTYSKVNVWCSDFEFANEDVTQAFVIVLPGVNRHMLAILIEDIHYNTQPDDLRPGTENCHYFHR